MWNLVSIMAVLAILYLLVCVLMYVFQGKLVFFPTRDLTATPERIGLAYEEIVFKSADGVDLHGWWVPVSGTGQVLLFFHGNAGNISDRLESLRQFHDLGLAVFLFDYRGYGQSRGRPSETGTYRDARGAWDYLTRERGVAPGDIILFGRSLGGAVAVELATQVQPRALIVEATFTSAAELGARVYPWLPVRQMARIRYDSVSRIRTVRCPKLFIHSLDDEVVPYGLGLRLFRAAREPKQMLKIRGSHGEGFLVSEPQYLAGLKSFLAALVDDEKRPPG